MKQTLESECQVAIKWFHDIKMIINPDKFQVTVLDKRRINNIEVELIIGLEQVQVVPSVDILSLMIDDKLTFNWHIDEIRLKSANQLVRLKHFLENEEKIDLINLIVLSAFNYCPLVWMLTNPKSVNEIGAIQKRALRFMLNDYESVWKDLLKKSENPSMDLLSCA